MTKGKRRKNKTKKKRRLCAIRRVAKEYGLEGLYFYCSFYSSKLTIGTIKCSSFCNNSNGSFLVGSPGRLKNLLDNYKCGKIIYDDDNMEFNSFDEFKTHILIKQLAGIK